MSDFITHFLSKSIFWLYLEVLSATGLSHAERFYPIYDIELYLPSHQTENVSVVGSLNLRHFWRHFMNVFRIFAKLSNRRLNKLSPIRNRTSNTEIGQAKTGLGAASNGFVSPIPVLQVLF